LALVKAWIVGDIGMMNPQALDKYALFRFIFVQKIILAAGLCDCVEKAQAFALKVTWNRGLSRSTMGQQYPEVSPSILLIAR